jgi:hypothetical protein
MTIEASCRARISVAVDQYPGEGIRGSKHRRFDWKKKLGTRAFSSHPSGVNPLNLWNTRFRYHDHPKKE